MINQFVVRRFCSSAAAASAAAGIKPRLLLLGTGWGAFAVLKSVNHEKFDVTVVSPRNHMLFTPLLASTSVGTLEFRSIAEPLKYSFPHVTYVHAHAVGIDAAKRTVKAAVPETPSKQGPSGSLSDNLAIAEAGPGATLVDVPYDALVVGIGARNNTFNIPGVTENLYFLKELSDAVAVRKRIMANVEAASVPGLPEEQRRRLMSFVICGGGPTGIEFCAELHDLLEQDIAKLYPELMADVSLTVVEGKSILGAFDASLREYAERKFKRDRIRILTGANVVRVEPTQMHLSDGRVVPYGMGVWNTGLAPRPLIAALDGGVFAKNAWGHLLTDDRMRVLAGPALTAPPQAAAAEASGSSSSSGSGSSTGSAAGAGAAGDQLAHWQGAKMVLPNVFAIGDCTSVMGQRYPATAQVAEQQGHYVGKCLNDALIHAAAAPAGTAAASATKPAAAPNTAVEAAAAASAPPPALPAGLPASTAAQVPFTRFTAPSPFAYNHGGSLAFLGSWSAVSDFTSATAVQPLEGSRIKGLTSFLIWRSAYLTKLGAWRNRLQVPADWTRTILFGRDVTQF